eukprot:953-Heterococcus_DN1.PRE.7
MLFIAFQCVGVDIDGQRERSAELSHAKEQRSRPHPRAVATAQALAQEQRCVHTRQIGINKSSACLPCISPDSASASCAVCSAALSSALLQRQAGTLLESCPLSRALQWRPFLLALHDRAYTTPNSKQRRRTAGQNTCRDTLKPYCSTCKYVRPNC